MRKIIAFVWDMLCVIPLLLLIMYEYTFKGLAAAVKKLNLLGRFMKFANNIHFKIEK